MAAKLSVYWSTLSPLKGGCKFLQIFLEGNLKVVPLDFEKCICFFKIGKLQIYLKEARKHLCKDLCKKRFPIHFWEHRKNGKFHKHQSEGPGKRIYCVSIHFLIKNSHLISKCCHQVMCMFFITYIFLSLCLCCVYRCMSLGRWWVHVRVCANGWKSEIQILVPPSKQFTVWTISPVPTIY